MSFEIAAAVAGPEFRSKDESFVRHARRVLGSRFRQAGLQASAAEDLTQECLLELITHFDRFDPAKGNIDSWISGFARNALRSWWRRESSRRSTEVPYVQIPESGMATTENFATGGIRSGLRQLCLVDQELLYMRFALGLSFDEVAANTGLSSVNARKRVSRAVEKLRQDPSVREALGL